MPPSPPATVATKFQKRITDLLRDFDELLLAVHGKHRQASLESMIAEQSVMLIAVLWEAYINDLFIAYVTRDPTSCLENFEERFFQSINEKFTGAVKWVSLDFPPTPSQTQMEKLLDPKGWNVTVRSAQGLSELANRHMNAVDAIKFSLVADDRDLVDYLVSLRDYLSHRSTGSRRKFAESVKALRSPGPNDRLKAPVGAVGPYLKHRIAPGVTRVNVIGQLAQQISAKLV